MLTETPRSGTLASFNYDDPLLPVKSWACIDYIRLGTKSKNTSTLRFLIITLKRKHLIAYYNQQC